MRQTIFQKSDYRMLEATVAKCIETINKVSEDKNNYNISRKEALEYLIKSLTFEINL